MRGLIDECLPRKLKRELPEHDCKTVTEMGWSGKKNDLLLQLMNPLERGEELPPDVRDDLHVVFDLGLSLCQPVPRFDVADVTMMALLPSALAFFQSLMS